MRVCRFGLGLAAAFFLSMPAWGQISVYGQATGANLQYPNTSHLYGGTFGLLATKPVGPLSMGADFRGAMLHRGSSVGAYNDQSLDMGQLGVRVAAAPHVLPLSLMPYAEALAGLGYWRGGISTSRQDKNHSMFQVVVGTDVPVYKRLQWRVFEATYGRAGAQPGSINPITVSTGFVINLPPGFFHQAQ